MEGYLEMLETSQEDLKEYYSSMRISRLRDASNKLLGALEEFTASKKGKLFHSYSEFKKCFLNLPVKLSIDQKPSLLYD